MSWRANEGAILARRHAKATPKRTNEGLLIPKAAIERDSKMRRVVNEEAESREFNAKALYMISRSFAQRRFENAVEVRRRQARATTQGREAQILVQMGVHVRQERCELR